MIEWLEPRVLSAASNAAGGAPAVPAGPDLRVAAIGRLRGPVIAGEASRVALAVRNGAAATGAAPPSLIGMYLSADGVLDAGDRLIASAPVTRPLKPGGVFRNRVDMQFPADLASGTYHVLARVDDGNAVAEGDETNNVADGGTIEVVAPFVDLVPLKVTRVRLRSWRGMEVNGGVTVVIRNDGNVPFDGDLNGVMLSQEVHPSGLVGQQWPSPFSRALSVKPGATAKIAVSFDSPTVQPEYVFTLTVPAPNDPTPDQSIWVRAKVVFLSWADRRLTRGGIVAQGLGEYVPP